MIALLVSLAVSASAASLGPSQSDLDALLASDSRLASVSTRLLARNEQLCRQHMPLTGIELQSSDQYPDPASTGLFRHAPISAALVAPGSPAAHAGIQAGDGIEAIGGQALRSLVRNGGTPIRDAAFEILSIQTPAAAALDVSSANGRRSVVLASPQGCRVLVEIRVTAKTGARSNGQVIQVDSGLAELVDDDGLAVIVAHELAHTVLEHRRRLEALGVSKGFFGEFGRNQRLNRQMEVEADRLSVHLLANAGWSPSLAPQFWRSPVGKRIGGTLLHSAVYPSAEGRARLLEQEVADYLGGNGPSWPGHLLSRRDEARD